MSRVKGARLGSCVDCHDWVVSRFNAGIPKRCDPCKLASSRVRARTWYYANHDRAVANARLRQMTVEYREQQRDRRNANPEPDRARSRARYVAKREEYKVNAQRWVEANREKSRTYKQAWKKAHPLHARAYWQRRKARILAGTVVGFSLGQLEARLSMFSGCWVCDEPADEIDHVKPLSKGGLHALANLRPICGTCNRKKGDRWPWPTCN